MDLPLPLSLRALSDEVDDRLARIPTPLNEYGFDPFGASLAFARRIGMVTAFLYRHYFRVESHGIEKVPEGRVLLIANHAGNTLPFDGAMLSAALLLDAEPPRFARAMAEFYLPRIPWWSEMIHRGGAVVGTPENCVRLLEREEAIMVFPEGSRGFIKPFSQRYKLQRFGTGFARLALQTKTPIVPVGIVGSEEQSPGLLDSKRLARAIGAPAFPVTWFFPWLGLLGFLPLPVKYRIHFGDPIRLEGDPNDDDEAIGRQVERVKDEIALLLEEGLAQREGWFRVNDLEPVVWLIVFVISVTAHEAAHALAAYLGGDSTAYQGGQVSLNPIPHMQREPMGTVVIPLITTFTNGWPMGWASTPYDPFWAERHPRRAAWMAAAGPGANLALAVAALLFLKIGLATGLFLELDWVKPSRLVAGDVDWVDGMGRFTSMVLYLNTVLCILNLMPLPPLDGASVVTLFLPERLAHRVNELTRQPGFAMIGLFAVWFGFGPLIRPIFGVLKRLVYG